MQSFINNTLGEIITFDSHKEMEQSIRTEPVSFVFGDLIPGTMTDMGGYWKHPILYKGLLIEPGDLLPALLFYIGEINNLFDHRIVCDVIYRVSDTRLYKVYHNKHGRDYNYVKNKWK
jgi:hypothetical protein